jgi:hypothetical protein
MGRGFVHKPLVLFYGQRPVTGIAASVQALLYLSDALTVLPSTLSLSKALVIIVFAMEISMSMVAAATPSPSRLS